MIARAVVLATLFSLLLSAPAGAVAIERVVSPGGIVAWFVEDHSLPVIALEARFDGGAALDPMGKEGLANLAMDLLDEGAGDLDSEAYKRRLEDLAIRMDFDASSDRLSASLQSLSENRDAAADLLNLALTRPRFDADALARIKGELRAQIAQDAEEPRGIAGRVWWRTAFPDHPYGRRVQGSAESLASIDAHDLRGFIADRLARDNLAVGVVGDITTGQLKALLDRSFGGLSAAARPGKVAEAAVVDRGALLVVRRPIPQSVVTFGAEGLERDDPDWYAALVMNQILGGGGLSSRLSGEIREKRGLAYGVSSGLFALSHAGVLFGSVATRNERVAETLALLRAEWRRMREDGSTAAELAAAKTYVIGSFPLSLDSTRRIASLLVSMQVDGLGIDYLDRRAALIERVSLADVQRVARRLLDPDKLWIVVVGSPQGLEHAQEVEPDGRFVDAHAAESPAPAPAAQ